VALLFLSSFSLGCVHPSVEVLAIANEGFLVRSTRHAVIVDGLFRATAPYPRFYQQAPSEVLLQTMVTGEGLFENVDLVLVTHADGDHFHAATVCEFLKNHTESVLVGTPEVFTALQAEDSGLALFADRVLAPELEHGQTKEIEVKNIRTLATCVQHSGQRTDANNAYTVSMDGFSFLHEGDAERTPLAFAAVRALPHGVDLAFLHDWYVFQLPGREIVTTKLRPRAVVLMHHRWALASKARERLTSLDPEILVQLPPVTVFAAETARATFTSK